MRNAPRRRPSVEALESRHLPATFGIPWPEPQSLTLSFMPDGTAVGGAPSTLSQTLNATMPTQTWELEILRAVQSWAVLGNVNVALVSDNGQAPGQPGPLEGDPGFGDIRIGARPLSDNTLATSSPFDLMNNWSGDILLNSQASYGDGTNGSESLFNAVLHEAGHVFGLPDNPSDPTAAMYPLNTTVHTAPNAAEVALIQALYGVRPANPLGNTTLATASPIAFVTNGSAANVVSATLESEADVDVYRVVDTAPTGTFAVDLQTSGISLLTARVTVENASGQVVASAAAPDAIHGNITLTVPGAVSGAPYFIKVQGANADVFAVGSFRLAVGPARLAGQAVSATPAATPSATGNTSFGKALTLTSHTPGTDARWPYVVQGTLSNPAATQYFAIQASSAPASALLVTVWASHSQGLAPQVTVFDASHHSIAAQILSRDASSETVEVLSPTPGAQYVVAVSAAHPTGARAQAIGGYTLAATSPSAAIAPTPTLATGTLGASDPLTTLTLNVANAEVYQLDLDLTSGGTSSTSVSVTVINASGKVVEHLIARGKKGSATGDVVLPTGKYTVRIQGATRAGAPLPTIVYTLLGTNRSQPIGPSPTDTTLDPVATPADSTPSTFGSDLVVEDFSLSTDLLNGGSMLMVDPVGGIVWD